MRFVFVTGMSGAGKSTVLKSLEDLGFFCVDNLPVALVLKFVELIRESDFNNENIAVGIDIRSGEALVGLSGILDELKKSKIKSEDKLLSDETNDKDIDFEILFLDASNKTLVRRFKETRREHPLARGGTLEDGINQERHRVEFLMKKADYTIDTSTLLTRELKAEISKIFNTDNEYENMIVTIMSFGYKFGVPQDADYVIDVRFLPNPYYEEDLRRLTGNDQEVKDYVMNSEESEEFVEALTRMMSYVTKQFTINEDRHQLVIAIGCTGGRHRSVTVANELYDRMSLLPYSVRVFHRDIINDVYVKGEK
ncbi:MAG: RNase adapter RapZ [Eubacterium sp.]|nr:RNase adapter RapZ [Eubacterium sp.]